MFTDFGYLYKQLQYFDFGIKDRRKPTITIKTIGSVSEFFGANIRVYSNYSNFINTGLTEFIKNIICDKSNLRDKRKIKIEVEKFNDDNLDDVIIDFY